MQLAWEGKTRQFWAEDNLLFTKGNHLYVPRSGNLRRLILKEFHDTPWAGHNGWQRTYALLKRGYYWPNLHDQFRKICLICLQDKVERNKIAGLLEPLPVLSRPWESISLDFITHLSKVGEMESILVIIDRFSKYATFIPTRKSCSAEATAQLFFRHVVTLWGIPTSIVNDRDPRFTETFWTELLKLLGSSLNVSFSYHPQTDGQTERFNSMLEELLCHFIDARQKNLVQMLDVAEFSFNCQQSSSTGKTPSEIVCGKQPLMPHVIDHPVLAEALKYTTSPKSGSKPLK